MEFLIFRNIGEGISAWRIWWPRLLLNVPKGPIYCQRCVATSSVGNTLALLHIHPPTPSTTSSRLFFTTDLRILPYKSTKEQGCRSWQCSLLPIKYAPPPPPPPCRNTRNYRLLFARLAGCCLYHRVRGSSGRVPSTHYSDSEAPAASDALRRPAESCADDDDWLLCWN